jgi:iron(III) transport system substrate-binding protein
MRPEYGSALLQVLPFMFAYNTDLVTDPPTDWPDLLAPDFANQIMVSNPAVSIAFIGFWERITQEYGEDFVQDLIAQGIRLVEGGAPGTAAVGAGEAAIHIPSTGGLIAGAAGAPVAGTVPPVTTGVEMFVGLTAQAQNPNAAKLFIDFVMSEEGNNVLGYAEFDAGVFPSNNDYIPGYQSPPQVAEERADEIRGWFNVD